MTVAQRRVLEALKNERGHATVAWLSARMGGPDMSEGAVRGCLGRMSKKDKPWVRRAGESGRSTVWALTSEGLQALHSEQLGFGW